MFRSPTSAPLLLLVDDDPYQAEVASYIAYELGCDFESALSGTEALEKVDARRPDVVLLDVRMPDLSGYVVCRRIKTVGATAGTQVIFVTARTEEEDLLQGFEALANDYVTKPFSARELKARVKNALRIKGLLDALTARTQILELQQEISAKVEEDGVTAEQHRHQASEGRAGGQADRPGDGGQRIGGEHFPFRDNVGNDGAVGRLEEGRTHRFNEQQRIDQPDHPGCAHAQHAQHHEEARDIGADHDGSATDAVVDHARGGGRENLRQHLQHHRERHGLRFAAGKFQQQVVDGQSVEPVAEFADHLRDP